MKKNYKGFTLIELIVVIAIIGVLAAILVPAMMGWVRKASINSANANAKLVFTAAQTYCQEQETKGSVVNAVNSASINENLAGKSGFNWTVSVNQGIVQAAAAETSGWWGGYPNQRPSDKTASADNNAASALACASSGGTWH